MDTKKSDSKKEQPRQNEYIKVCSINICGLSERSRFMLDKYVFDKQIDIVCVQETGSTDPSKLNLCNMNAATDSNKAANKGCALFVRSGISSTPLPEISKISSQIDSVWSLVVLNNKRYVMGTVYVKLGHLNGISEIVKMLHMAQMYAKKYHALGPLLVGDINARHESWGDSTSNKYGQKLLDELNPVEFSVIAPTQPTFLAQNGSSVIDLVIASNDLVGKLTLPSTDNLVNLYSGAPLRGHVPINFNIATDMNPKPKTVIKDKLDMKDIDWDLWRENVDLEVVQRGLLQDSESSTAELNHSFEKILLEMSEKHGRVKRSTIHSKPHWTAVLTELSDVLRDARGKYQQRNTDTNLMKYKESKEAFDNTRKEECRKFILRKTSNLNAAQSSQFWKEFNKVFKTTTDNAVESFLKDDLLVTERESIEEILFETFFEGLHLKEAESTFDQVFYTEVNTLYDQIKQNSFDITGEVREKDTQGENKDTHFGCLNDDVTFWEICQVIKSSSPGGKSFDNNGIHPIMLKNLGTQARNCLLLIFNRTFREGRWLWNKASVIFLKKDGKDTYSKPGAYRPISISPYVGKMLESILAHRLDLFLFSSGHTDPCQEGFTRKRNTVRYLNRLHLSIKGDIDKKLTVLCLFLDMEKAFDSVWKKGLIAKLYQYGVNGHFLQIINDFLMNRYVSLVVNGFVGPLRRCLEFGLPQGSALSPILFRFFLIDMLADMEHRDNIEIFKFADDGSAKATGRTTKDCIMLMKEICASLYLWSCKWRMVINCNPNKTELICFNTAEKDLSLLPPHFCIGNQDVQIVSKTKVLGLTIDNDLSFATHRNNIYKRLCFRWVTICQYTNRNWGLNQNVLVRLTQTLFLSCMCYAGIVWMRGSHMEKINHLWYKLLKTAIGAVFNISQTRAEVILGLPPLEITNRINTIKHYLKINIFKEEGDKLKELVSSQLIQGREMNRTLRNEIKEVFLFLEWKKSNAAVEPSVEDREIISNKDYALFQNLSAKVCGYSKEEIVSYTELIWQKSLDTVSKFNGEPFSPPVSCKRLDIPSGTSREDEVLFMSMLYPNNLLRYFVNKKFPNIETSPMCICGKDYQAPFHIIIECQITQDKERKGISDLIDKQHLSNRSIDGCEVLIGLSREKKFVDVCLNIISSGKHQLRKKIILPKPKKDKNNNKATTQPGLNST